MREGGAWLRPLVLFVLVVPATAQAGENRAWSFDVRLRGPLEEVRFDFGAEGTTRVHAALRAGEELALSLPAPVRSPLGAVGLAGIPLPPPTLRGSGAVEVGGWSPAPAPTDFDLLPPGLRTRPRPPLAAGRPRAVWGVLALLGLGFVLGFAARRRPGRASLVGVVVGGAVLALTLRSAAPADGVRLLEGDLRARVWFEVRAGLGSLERVEGRLERLPVGGAVAFDVVLEGGRKRVAARAPGAVLYEVRVLTAPAAPDPALFGRGAPAATWWRDSAGAWSRCGPWRWGDPLPAPLEAPGEEEPPGWLKAGLPPGIDVLLGRLGAEGGGSWLRVTGPF